MKFISKIVIVLMFSVGLMSACKKTENVKTPEDTVGKTIAPVTNLVAIPTDDEHEIELSWTNPNDDALLKVMIAVSPADTGGKATANPVLVNATKGTEQKTTIIVTQALEYTFTVTTVNKAGAKSSAEVVKATPYSTVAPDNTPLRLKRADTLMTSMVQLYLDGKARDIWSGFYPFKNGYWDGAATNWGHGGAFSGYVAMKEAAEAYPVYKDKIATLYDVRLLTGFDKFRNTANGKPEAYAVYPGSGDERFYDDNIWVGLDMVDLYKLTKDVGYLDRAQMIWRFILSGTDSKMGGGVYWKEYGNTKNTCSSAPAAVLAAKLYMATNDPAYLQSAKDLYTWTKTKLQDPADYLYWDNVRLSNEANPNSALIVDKSKYPYNSGQPMQAAALLYTLTGQQQYLTDAQNIAAAAYKRWFIPFHSYTMGESFNILEPGHLWFQAIMLRGFIELYKLDGNKTYVKAYQKTMDNAWLSSARNRTTNLINNDLRGGTTQAEFDILFQGACLEMISRLALLEHEGL